MSQEDQGTNSATPESLPVKRKRGRPRKDSSVIHGEKVSDTPRTDSVKRNQRRKTDPVVDEDDSMVGQVVSGVLDGSFDAGYLLTVRIDNTDTILRGIVFEPGLSIPVSGANDVAPQVKMFKRIETPLPVVDPRSQVHGSTSQTEKKSEQSIKVLQRGEASLLPNVSSPIHQLPKVVALPSQHLTTPVTLKGMQIDTSQVVEIPQAPPEALHQAEDKMKKSGNLISGRQLGDVNQVVRVSSPGKDLQIEMSETTAILPKDKVDLPPGGGLENTNQGSIITPLQAAQSELKEHASATQPLPVEQNKNAKLTVLQNDGDTSKGLMLELRTEPSVEISLSSENMDLVPPTEHQVAGSNLKPEQCIDVEFKEQTVEFNNTTVAAAPQHMNTPITEPFKMLQGNQTFEEVNMLQATATESEFSVEIPRRDETSHSKERQSSDAVEATSNDAQSNPTDQPIEMLNGVAIHSPYGLEAVLADKQSVLPNEPQISNSIILTENADFVSKEAAPPVQSNKDTDYFGGPPKS